jgi:hypothetical protein
MRNDYILCKYVDHQINFVSLLFLILRQGLTFISQAVLNSRSSCLGLPSAGIIGVFHHTWLKLSFFYCA